MNETVKFGVRLATGGDNPISTNQTLDGFASTKDFGVDRAYVAWTPVKGSTITAGRWRRHSIERMAVNCFGMGI